MISKFIYNKGYRLCLLIFIITIQSSALPIGYNNYIWWFIDFLTIYTLLQFRNKSKKYPVIETFLLWTLISIIRGAFIAENYWEWKQFINGIISLSIPLFIYALDKPSLTGYILKFWFKYAIILFAISVFFLPTGAYHFLLGPVFVIGCFIPIIPRKWKICLIIILFTMILINFSARSQVIKSAMVLLIALLLYLRKYTSIISLKIFHWSCYIIPIILLILGISGKFNIFEDLSSHKGKYIEKKIINGQVIEDDLSADTRTFIYKEVIESAINHNYLIYGRTPARGNDSAIFGAYNAEELKTGKYERHKNELCHTNIFTWLGLIGVILYSLIYLKSSYLSLYKSNNIYIKYLSCFIAFRWAYGWIEDMNNFNIMNIALWMMIAMGISAKFRAMNNYEFKQWLLKSLPK